MMKYFRINIQQGNLNCNRKGTGNEIKLPAFFIIESVRNTFRGKNQVVVITRYFFLLFESTTFHRKLLSK